MGSGAWLGTMGSARAARGGRFRARKPPASDRVQRTGFRYPRPTMPTPPLPLVWLFDVDGTLLLTQGAGRDALSLALRDQFCVDDDLTSMSFGGRTDLLILADICARHGLAFRDGEQARFWDRVAFHMRVLMDPPRGSLLPGVPALLDAVSAEPTWVRALLTGNMS